MKDLRDMSVSEMLSTDFDEEFEPLIDLSGSNLVEEGNDEENEEDPFDMLSIVLNETEKEEKVAKGLEDTDDIFGLKEMLLAKSLESDEKLKKGKMSEKQLKDMTSRKTGITLSEINIIDQINKGFLQAGLNKIWEMDGEYQEEILRDFMRDIRNIPENYLDAYVNRLKSIGAFFNPNDEYMKIVFGSEITQSRYGIYDSDESNKYTMRLMMPLRFFDNSIVGFVGYSPVENTEGRTIKYLYPRKEVLEKSRILATEVDVFKKAINDGYICLTDGYFDAFSLNVYGINAASLCGSAVTKYHKLFLSKIKTKIIIPDNDKAGTKLEKTIKTLWPNSRAIHQSETKDIDEFLGNSSNIEKICKSFNDWGRRGFLQDLYI